MYESYVEWIARKLFFKQFQQRKSDVFHIWNIFNKSSQWSRNADEKQKFKRW